MKKLFLLTLFPVLFFAQDLTKDSVAIMTSFSKDDFLYSDFKEYICSGRDLNHFPKEETNGFFVTDVINCDKKKFLAGYYSGEYNYIEYTNTDKKFRVVKNPEKINYDIDDIENALKGITESQKEKLKFEAKEYSKALLLGRKDKLFDYIMSFQKYPIAIIQSYPTDDYSMTGAKFEIMNFSPKTIKYITFNFYGKNAVKDKVQYRKGVFNTSRKGIGPVERYRRGSWSFDSVWLTDIVQTLELTSVNIQYMDGTTKLIKITDAMWINDDRIYEFEQLSEQWSKVSKEYQYSE